MEGWSPCHDTAVHLHNTTLALEGCRLNQHVWAGCCISDADLNQKKWAWPDICNMCHVRYLITPRILKASYKSAAAVLCSRSPSEKVASSLLKPCFDLFK